MDRSMIEDLKSGDELKQLFLLRSKALRTARNNSLYMQLELADRTGVIPGHMWDARQELFDTFQPDDFVFVRGRVETYQNKLQAIVQSIEPRPESEADIADFIPTTNKDVGAMFDRLIEIAKMVKDPGLRKLLASFLKDDDISGKLRRCPAAVVYHHAVIGGLLEHTLGVSELALAVADQYPDLDRDTFITGAILHDIGKIEEFQYERSFAYTDAGELLGHLYIGARMIEERAADIPEMTPEKVKALTHLVLSHHGEYEYQSPKLPMTAEALAVHHLDNLDAKINAFRAAMLRDRDPESRWTEWNKMFERKLFKGFGPAN
ncbi:MAG: HD domain-containing protein [Planctomycetota bacterium]